MKNLLHISRHDFIHVNFIVSKYLTYGDITAMAPLSIYEYECIMRLNV